MGNVLFHYYSKAFWDEYDREIRSKDNQQASDRMLQKMHGIFQGTVIASVEAEGDSDKCLEVALAQTALALDVLRFYSPAAFVGPVTAVFGMEGRTLLPKTVWWTWEDQHRFFNERLQKYDPFEWVILASDLERFKQDGFHEASDLVSRDGLSEFEEVLLSSLTLFARSTAAPDFHDKLVYLLSAIETLLLGGATEPIQTNLGLRLAFLVENTREGRKEVDRLVRVAYGYRSQYLHHGKKQENYEVLMQLKHSAWTAIRNALTNKGKFAMHTQFIEAVRNSIYS